MTIENSRSGMGNLNRRVVVPGTGFYSRRSPPKQKPSFVFQTMEGDVRVWALSCSFSRQHFFI